MHSRHGRIQTLHLRAQLGELANERVHERRLPAVARMRRVRRWAYVALFLGDRFSGGFHGGDS